MQRSPAFGEVGEEISKGHSRVCLAFGLFQWAIGRRIEKREVEEGRQWSTLEVRADGLRAREAAREKESRILPVQGAVYTPPHQSGFLSSHHLIISATPILHVDRRTRRVSAESSLYPRRPCWLASSAIRRIFPGPLVSWTSFVADQWWKLLRLLLRCELDLVLIARRRGYFPRVPRSRAEERGSLASLANSGGGFVCSLPAGELLLQPRIEIRGSGSTSEECLQVGQTGVRRVLGCKVELGRHDDNSCGFWLEL